MDQKEKADRITRVLKGGFLSLCLFVVVNLCQIPQLNAQQTEESAFRVGGLLFGDFYYVNSHHLDDGNGATGLVLRRGYLTLVRDGSAGFVSSLTSQENLKLILLKLTSRTCMRD